MTNHYHAKEVQDYDAQLGFIENRPELFDKHLVDCEINSAVRKNLLKTLTIVFKEALDMPVKSENDITFDHIRHLEKNEYPKFRGLGEKSFKELDRIVRLNKGMFYEDHEVLLQARNIQKNTL